MCDDANGKTSKSDDENELSASDDSSEPEEVPNNAPFDPEFDEEDDEDDGEKVIEIPTQDGGPKTSTFSLKGGGSGFSSRSHNIFDCLDSMAKMTSSSLGQDNVIDGVFARPVAPPPSRKTSHPPSTSPTPAKKRGKPDYMLNPDRWTHYSLEDVAETSDQGNSRVAQQFLAGLQHKKEDTEVEEPYDGQQKILFSKPKKMGKEQAANKQEKGSKEKGMRLCHLDEEEEDEEEDKKEVGKRPKQSIKTIDLNIKETQSGVEQEKDEVDSGFVAFKKNRKAYRKTTEET